MKPRRAATTQRHRVRRRSGDHHIIVLDGAAVFSGVGAQIGPLAIGLDDAWVELKGSIEVRQGVAAIALGLEGLSAIEKGRRPIRRERDNRREIGDRGVPL